jgi:threonine/homoserine/homoserine lactone efflux protein
MLTEAIGEMLPAIMAIALTPLQLVGVVLVLGGPNGRAAGPSFLIGWLAALGAVTVVAILLIEKLGQGGRAASPFVHWLQFAVGLLLLGTAIRLWRTRPLDGAEAAMPKWLASIGEAGPLRAFVVGALMAFANPKTLALVLAAMTSLAYLTLSMQQVAAFAFFFVILGSSPLIALVLAHAVGGQKTNTRIERLKSFMLRNNNVILMVVFAMLGMSVLGNGVSGLR